MKSTIIILLITIMAIQTFSKWIVIMVCEVNRDYIACNLCVDRAKPSSCCKGKCFLQKKMAIDEDQQQSSGKQAHQEDAGVDLFLDDQILVNLRLPLLIKSRNFFCLNGASQEFAPSFFQPPQC